MDEKAPVPYNPQPQWDGMMIPIAHSSFEEEFPWYDMKLRKQKA